MWIYIYIYLFVYLSVCLYMHVWNNIIFIAAEPCADLYRMVSTNQFKKYLWHSSPFYVHVSLSLCITFEHNVQTQTHISSLSSIVIPLLERNTLCRIKTLFPSTEMGYTSIYDDQRMFRKVIVGGSGRVEVEGRKHPGAHGRVHWQRRSKCRFWMATVFESAGRSDRSCSMQDKERGRGSSSSRYVSLRRLIRIQSLRPSMSKTYAFVLRSGQYTDIGEGG